MLVECVGVSAKQSLSDLVWSCFHNLNLDDMKSCVLVNTVTGNTGFMAVFKWLCIAEPVLHCFSVHVNNGPKV